jgi:hypothetical protein
VADNKWNQPLAPNPPLFLNEKERNLQKQINDELIERVIGQEILYYPISREHTNYHPIYGEAIQKNFLSPIRVYCLVEWEGIETKTEQFNIDKMSKIKVHFHKRRLTEDQDLYIREGDFVLYGANAYEILSLNEPKQMFGQIEFKTEILATCLKARDGVFNAR